MRTTLIKWLLLALAVIGLVVAARLLPVDRLADALDEWVAQLGVAGPFVFAIVYVLAVVLLLPAWILTVAAGSIFGLAWGTVIAWLSATTGAGLAFLVSRYFAREWVEGKIVKSPRFRAIDAAIGEGGWKIVALLRLSPVVPFSLQNYFYGLTPIRFWPCVITSCLAMLPGTFLYAYLGYLGRSGLETASGESPVGAAQWTLRIVGLLATVAATVYISRLARKALAEKTGRVPPDASEPQHEQKATP